MTIHYPRHFTKGMGEPICGIGLYERAILCIIMQVVWELVGVWQTPNKADECSNFTTNRAECFMFLIHADEALSFLIILLTWKLVHEACIGSVWYLKLATQPVEWTAWLPSILTLETLENKPVLLQDSIFVIWHSIMPSKISNTQSSDPGTLIWEKKWTYTVLDVLYGIFWINFSNTAREKTRFRAKLNACPVYRTSVHPTCVRSCQDHYGIGHSTGVWADVTLYYVNIGDDRNCTECNRTIESHT